MKKQIIYLITAVMLSGLISCNNSPQGKKVKSTNSQRAESSSDNSVKHKADTLASIIEWTGSKPAGEHHGTINVKEGYLLSRNDSLTGGEFIINMESIRDTDLTDADMNAKLVGHLKSPDFFNVDSFPTARFVITKIIKTDTLTPAPGEIAPNYLISGNLTLKDITRNVTFRARVNKSGNTIDAQSEKFVIDRSEWNVRYGSRTFFDNLKNKYINDDIGLRIKLVFLN